MGFLDRLFQRKAKTSQARVTEGDQGSATSREAREPQAAGAVAVPTKSGAVACAACRSSFCWLEAYWQRETPGDRQGGLSRAFCPHCGALVAEYDPRGDQWHWVGGSADVNRDSPLPPNPFLLETDTQAWYARQLPDMARVPLSEKVVNLALLRGPGGPARAGGAGKKRSLAELQELLWRLVTKTGMKEFIAGLSGDEIAELVAGLDPSRIPFSFWKKDGSLDQRLSSLCVFLSLFANQDRVGEVEPLLGKLLRHFQNKIDSGPAPGDEFSNPNHFSAAALDIVFALAMDLFKARQEAALTCLEALLTDFPHHQNSLFWRFAACYNLFTDTKDDSRKRRALVAGQAYLDEVGSGVPQSREYFDTVRSRMSELRE